MSQTFKVPMEDLRKLKIAALEAEVQRLSLLVCTGNPRCPACATVHISGMDDEPMCVKDLGWVT